MSPKPQDAGELYRQFRALNAKDRDTSDAIQCFSRHLGTEQTHQLRIDKIVASIPDNQAALDNSQRSLIETVKQWFAQCFLVSAPGPMFKFAVLGLCGFIVVGLFVNQKPYPWETFIPEVVIEAGLTVSRIEAISGSAQMGFTPSGHELAAHYLLGKVSTQLALSMALKDDSEMSYFAASYGRLSSTGLSPDISQQVEALRALLSNKAARKEIGRALAELKQAVHKQSQQPLDGFVLGQYMEALRLALEIADTQDNVFVLQSVSSDVAKLQLNLWYSNDLPKLNGVLIQIHGLVQGKLSLSERRQLMQLLQQLDVLLG